MSSRLHHRLAHQNTGQKTGNPVFARTSVTGAPHVFAVSPSVNRQFAPVAPPLADLRRPPFGVFAGVFASHSLVLPALTQEGSGAEGPLACPQRLDAERRVTRHCTFLIYGTGIKKLRKPTPISEYKLLIYGKPPVARSNWRPGWLCGTRLSRDTGTATAALSSNPNASSFAPEAI